MSKRKSKNKVPMKIEQNTPVNPPQSFGWPHPSEKKEGVNMVSREEFEKEYPPLPVEKEIPVATTPRGVIMFKLKSLAHDIAELEPHSKSWCDMLEEIGNLKRKAGKL